MKSKDEIKRFVAETRIGTDEKRDRQVLSEVLQTHEDFKHGRSQQRSLQIWRTFMTYPRARIAAIVAVVLLLIGAFSFGGGTAAAHAVGSTLSRLKQMLTDMRTQRAHEAMSPAGPTGRRGMGARRGGASGRGSTFVGTWIASEFCVSSIPGSTEDFQRFLKEQKIEPVQASPELQVNYAPLDPEQVERIVASLQSTAVASSRVMAREGQEVTIGSRNLAALLAWRSTLTGDSRRVESSVSFQDSQNGFEIPTFTVESGGGVLMYGEIFRPAWSADIIILRFREETHNP